MRKSLKNMARAEGLEPPTFRFEAGFGPFSQETSSGEFLGVSCIKINAATRSLLPLGMATIFQYPDGTVCVSSALGNGGTGVPYKGPVITQTVFPLSTRSRTFFSSILQGP
jgi:hypothetical protein